MTDPAAGLPLEVLCERCDVTWVWRPAGGRPVCWCCGLEVAPERPEPWERAPEVVP